MEDKNVVSTPLWEDNGSQVETRPLRRPFQPPEELDDSFSNLSVSSASNDDILSTSKLSADAKEWFPPNYNQSTTPQMKSSKSVQNRLERIRSQTSTEPLIDRSNIDEDESVKDIDTLREILCTLNDDPAQFESLFDAFNHTMEPYYEDPNFVLDTAKMLLKFGLEYPNIRYNAAKICSIIEELCPLFAPSLHMTCQNTFKENGCNPNFALFLGELCNQLHRNEIHVSLLMKVLCSVLVLGTSEAVKAVCQVLKLTGFALESLDKKGVDSIFNTLETLKSTLPHNILLLINSVQSLRASNWGHSQDSTQNSINRPDNVTTKIDNGLVFYGPDGMELTEEEERFMFENCDNSSNGDDSDDGWVPNPDMDEEMQAAYKEFLKMKG